MYSKKCRLLSGVKGQGSWVRDSASLSVQRLCKCSPCASASVTEEEEVSIRILRSVSDKEVSDANIAYMRCTEPVNKLSKYIFNFGRLVTFNNGTVCSLSLAPSSSILVKKWRNQEYNPNVTKWTEMKTLERVLCAAVEEREREKIKDC